MPLKFLVYLVILCFDMRYPIQNTVARLKSNILALKFFLAAAKFWSGYATAQSGRSRDPHFADPWPNYNQLDLDYRTHQRNLCNKHIPADTHHNRHGDLRERQSFVVHMERRRLLYDIRLKKVFRGLCWNFYFM